MKLYLDGIIYASQNYGGISRYFNEFLPILINNCPEIQVEMLLHNKKKKILLSKCDKIKFARLPQIPTFLPRRLSAPIKSRINKYQLKNYWKRKKNGVFHSTYFTTYQMDIPQILTVHDLIYEKFPNLFNTKNDKNFIKKKKDCINNAETIICVSQNTKKDIIKYYNVNEKKVSVVYHGYSDEFKEITDKKIKQDFLKRYTIKKNFLLYIGSRTSYKNFLSLLKAFSKIDDSLILITIGGGNFTKEELSFISKLGLTNRIYNLSCSNDKDLALFYNCADTFILPSLYEGFGIPLLEAMACGTPIVASNTSSIPEIGKNAVLYCNPYDISDITKKIEQSLADKRKTTRIRNGFEIIKSFSWEKTAKQMEKIYKKYDQ